MSWKTTISTLGLASVCCLVSVPGVRAQGPGGGMPPEIAAKIKAWGKWRDAHKGISNVQTLFYQVEQMDKEKGYELNKVQSGKLLGIMKPWRTKPEMSDDQAKSMMKSVTGMLTDKQVKKMTTIQAPWARQGGGGGGGRPGGAGGGGGRPGGGGGRRVQVPGSAQGWIQSAEPGHAAVRADASSGQKEHGRIHGGTTGKIQVGCVRLL